MLSVFGRVNYILVRADEITFGWNVNILLIFNVVSVIIPGSYFLSGVRIYHLQEKSAIENI